MRFYWLILGTLCVWRLAHFLYAEDGPWDILVSLRRAVGEGVMGRLLDCFYCLTLWISLPITLLIAESVTEKLLMWPALSGGAILLERVTAPVPAQLQASYIEDEEEEDGMLRSTEKPTPQNGRYPPEA